MGFSQALSGLNAAATNLDVIGNNIANSQTVGFKGSRTQFADAYASAQGGVLRAGLGTKVAGILQNFNNGNLQATGRALDLAVDGMGFLRFFQNGQALYSRNGELTLTNEGYLINAQGANLTGYPPGVGTGGEPIPLRVAPEPMPPSATTLIDISLNLDSREPSYTNSATVYDSLGTPHDLTMIFTNNNDNTWTVSLELNGAPMNMVGGTTLTYDTNGLSGMTSFAANLDMGPNVSQLELDLNVNSTQFASHSQLNALQQNGYAAGDLLGITINDDGSIIGNYSNLQTAEIGTIVLANFINPEGLQAIGDNAWIISASSGEPLLGRPGEGKFGLVESGALEGSNVDMTAELVNLIIAQRYYQSNAQTIKVQDEVLQTTINMR